MVYNLRPKLRWKHDSRTWKNYTRIAADKSAILSMGKEPLLWSVIQEVNLHEIEELLLSKLKGVRLIKADDYAYDVETITNKIAAEFNR